MPYCPKCDMEFVDGITICSDCGGPLAESEEAAKAMRIEERERFAREQAVLLHEQKLYESGEEELTADSDADDLLQAAARVQKPIPPTPVYVKKSQKYEDLKSSASAFILVGAALLIASALCWLGIVNLPMAGITKLIFQGVLTAMGAFAVGVAIHSSGAAKKLAPQIQDEEQRTRDLVLWFTDTYDAESIDQAIGGFGDLMPEELSLKRFQVIQDHLITTHDLPDPSYVDSLSEEIYAELYE